MEVVTMQEEVPITEFAIQDWIASDPERWLGEPMQLSRVGGRGQRPDLAGVDESGRPVVVEVKEETVYEFPNNRVLQHVGQVRRYVETARRNPGAYGLPPGKGAVRAFVVGQLVDGSAREACAAYGVEWREVTELVPGRPPSRRGHPKSTQWMRMPSQGAVMIALMEEFPSVTRGDLARKLRALKSAGFVRGGTDLGTCGDNVAFWTGDCPGPWYYVGVTPREAFRGDSPLINERCHLDPGADGVVLLWDDGTARKTALPEEWRRVLADV
jgi:hypothetical protein